MSPIVKLFDEKLLLKSLQSDSLVIIRSCNTIDPIKILIECHDILKLTLDIQNKYPSEFPELPVFDEDALLYLKFLVKELSRKFHTEMPQPIFFKFNQDMLRLLIAFRVPKENFMLK